MPYDIITALPSGSLARSGRNLRTLGEAEAQARRETNAGPVGTETYVIEGKRAYKRGDVFLLGFRRQERSVERITVDPAADRPDDETSERFALLELDGLPSKPPEGLSHRGSSTERSTSVVVEATNPNGTREVVESSAQTENLRVDAFAEPIANVKVSLGRTVNLGNYESARIDVSVTMPVRIQDVAGGYERARAFVDERLQEEIRIVKGRR